MSKKILKKLILQKEELVNLNDKQMDSAVGGTSSPVYEYVIDAAMQYTIGTVIEGAANYIDRKVAEYLSNVDTNNYNHVSDVVCMGGCMLPVAYVIGNRQH